jgi:hypothetical protein
MRIAEVGASGTGIHDFAFAHAASCLDVVEFAGERRWN